MYFQADERIIYRYDRRETGNIRGKKKIEKKISKIPRKHGLNGNIVVTMVVTGSLICLLLANPLK